MLETQIRPLGQEDSLEKGMATHSSIIAWRIPWTGEFHGQRSLVGYSSWGRKELDPATRLTHTQNELDIPSSLTSLPFTSPSA